MVYDIMKCNNFDAIKFNPIGRRYNHNALHQKEAIAFDTETRDGIPFLMCDSEGNVKTTKDDIINHLLDNYFQKTLNLFYNLGYDKNAILKLTLNDKNLRFFAKFEYAIEDNVYYGGIGNKSLDICRCYAVDTVNKTDKGYKTTYLDHDIKPKYTKGEPKIYFDYKDKPYTLSVKNRYFDLWQFFKYEGVSNLDAVSKKYLNDNKTPIESMGYNKSNLPLDKIVVDYCIQDCILTRDLANIVIEACNNIGILFNKPYSCATLSSDYFYNYNNIKNPYYFLYQYGNSISSRNKEIFKYAYKCYKGGRSEVVKRGHFEENVIEHDVNSMFPFHMTELYDCFKTNWIKVIGDNIYNFDIDNLAYGFINCDINYPKDYVCALPIKDGCYKYAYGNLKDYWITIHELYMLFNLGILDKSDVIIKDSWIGEKRDNLEYPYKEVVEYVYNERQKYSKIDFRNSLFKIILNSKYGRLIEVNINKNISAEINLNNIDEYDILEDDVVQKMYIAGKFFNPIYACYILALSRVQLFSALYPQKHALIGTFTDSIISTEKIRGVEIDDKKLGAWEVTEGELTMVGCGVYRLVGNSTKYRARGVHVEKSNDNDNLYGFNFDDMLTRGFTQTKVKKLKESVISTQENSINKFNTFQKEHKNINLNFDTKRKWHYDFNRLQDLYTGICDSEAIKV